MFRRGAVLFFILLGLCTARFAFAIDQSSTNYQNIGSSFAPAVKDISSASYLMTASFDAIVGLSLSPSYSLRNGVPLNDTVPVVPPVCGNGVTETGESCDNGGSNGVCPRSCSSSCTTNSCGGGAVVGGGGGGGPSGGPEAPAPTGIEFSGRAYPLSTVVVLKDGQILAQTIAGPDAKFKIVQTGLSVGSYVFGVYAVDAKGVKSSTFTFPIALTQGTVATVSGIFIASTISVNKDVVKRGDDVTFFGQSAPDAVMTIQVNSEPIFAQTDADPNGVYEYVFDTTMVDYGEHSAKSKGSLGGEVSPYSVAVGFLVNNTGIGFPNLGKPTCGKADLNCDGRVSIADFSIAAFWYKHPLSPVFLQIERERLNGDGKLDFIDFSFMAYYWSG